MAAPRRPRSNPNTSTNPFMDMFGVDVEEGRYPGKGIYRGPISKGVQQFNFDEVVDQIRDAIKNEVDNIGLTDNVQRLIWKDIENAFIVSISPKKETYDLSSQPELRSDEAEISGYQVSIDTNPIKWARDPGKMVQKTKDAFWNSFWNIEDVTSATELRLYNRLLEGDTRVPASALKEKYYEILFEPVKKIYDEPGKNHAFQLRGVDLKYTDTLDLLTEKGEKSVYRENSTNKLYGETDLVALKAAKIPQNLPQAEIDKQFGNLLKKEFTPVKKQVGYYDDMADGFRNFIKFSKAEGTRRGNYTDFGISSLKAIGADSERVKASIIDDIKQLKTQLPNATGQAAIDIRDKISELESDVTQFNGFLSRVKVADAIKDYQGPVGVLGLKGISLRLGQVKTGAVRPETVNKNLAKLMLGLDEIDKEQLLPDGVTKIKIKVLSPKDSNNKDVLSVAQSARKNIDEAVNLTKSSPSEKARTQMRLAPFERQVTALEQLGAEVKDQITEKDAFGNLVLKRDATLSKNLAGKLKGQVDDLKGETSRNGFFSGWADRTVEQYTEELMDPNSAIRVLMNQYDDKFLAAGNGINVLNEAKRIYLRESVRDALTKLEKKGVTGVAAEYVWSRIRTRLNGFTPAEVVKLWLQKHQYFGLVYNPDFVYGGNMYSLSVPWVNKLFRNKAFDNNISINLKEIGLGVGKIKFKGHRRFALALDLYERAKMDAGAQMHKLDMGGFFKLLNGDFSDPNAAFNLAVLGKMRLPPDVFYKDMISPALAAKMTAEQAAAHAARRRTQGMEAMSGEMRKWLIQYADAIGLDVKNGVITPSPENFEKLMGLFGKLFAMEKSSDFISILQGSAGVIQKLVSYLSKLQSGLFKYIGYAMAPYIYARNAASKWLSKQFIESKFGKKAVAAIMSKQAFKKTYEAAERVVVKWIAKLTGVAFSVGTEGMGLIAQWLVEHAVQAVLNKVVDLGKKVFGGLSPDNIDEFLDSTFLWVGKAAMTFFGCCAIGCSIPMFMMLGLLGTITPIDPTKSSNAYNAGIGGNGGPSIQCTQCCGPNTPEEICAQLPACGVPLAPGECEVSQSVGCFAFTPVEEWKSQQHYDVIFQAAEYLRNNHGVYVEKLCANAGIINVQWSDSVACGYKSGTTLSFGDQQCWSYIPSNPLFNMNLFYNLFAHESGHVYQDTHPTDDDCVDAANNPPEGMLPTYASGCAIVDHDEDFAETIANYVVARCGYSAAAYPAHAACASTMFND